MLTRRDLIAAAALSVAARTPAYAQGGYPARPIHIIVGYPAGGGVDIVARLLGEPMRATFGQTVLVENRPGASAMIAAGAVAKSPPDGLMPPGLAEGTAVAGLAGPQDYPALVAALRERGWEGERLDGLLSVNLLHFLRESLPA